MLCYVIYSYVRVFFFDQWQRYYPVGYYGHALDYFTQHVYNNHMVMNSVSDEAPKVLTDSQSKDC